MRLLVKTNSHLLLTHKFHRLLCYVGHGRKAADASGVCKGDDALGRGQQQSVDVLERVVMPQLFHPVGRRQEHKVALAPSSTEAPEFLQPAVPKHGNPTQALESRRIGAGSRHTKDMSIEVRQ